MPKPNYRGGGHHDFEQRDFRANDRRVSFKPGKHGSKKEHMYNRDWTASIRGYLQEEDVDMGVSSGGGPSGRNFNNKKMNKHGKRRMDSPVPGRKKLFLDAHMGWYKVQLPHGAKYEKTFLQSILLEKLKPLEFWPLAWRTIQTNSTFYVDDERVAEKLFNLDKQIQLPNGFRLVIKVFASVPHFDLSPENKEKMKLVMAKRYNPVTKALDLTRFHYAPELQDCTCAIYKPNILITVMEIIASNIPELEALNLAENKISHLHYLKREIVKLKNLKIFHIGKNRIRDIVQIDALIGLPIVDILLHENPLCDRFKDQASYISEVRKRLPKVMKLDGIQLPPPISFDIAEEVHLPSPLKTFLCNTDGQAIVGQFIKEYFDKFDSGNRQDLIQAYHENAVFSLTSAYPYGSKDARLNWLNWYNTDNRNLVKVQDSERRNKLLKQGRVSVVSFLQLMPETEHDQNTFTADLTLFTTDIVLLTVTGIFKELRTSHKTPPLRYFYRTLVIVPFGAGICITNETVHITNVLPEQAKEAFKRPLVPVSPVVAPLVVAPVAVPVLDDATKQAMVKQMCDGSGMNLEWSLRCLEDMQWDFNRATAIFHQLQSEGKVPPEAFIK